MTNDSSFASPIADIPDPGPGGIVVGYDRSAQSGLAVCWASQLAIELSRELSVIWAWRIRDVWDETLGDKEFVSVPSMTVLQSTASELVRHETEQLIGTQEHVRCHAVAGDAADVLLVASATADMLVVGSRGHGRLGTALLGSVSAACVRRSARPVVVVPRHMIRQPEN